MKPVDSAEPLTAAQLHIAQLFGAMDDRRQQEALVKLTRMAAVHPRRAKPTLRLVSSTAPPSAQ